MQLTTPPNREGSPGGAPPACRSQVLPFYESSVEEEEKAAADAADIRKSLQTSAAGKDGQPVEEWDYLNNFFKRYNKVALLFLMHPLDASETFILCLAGAARCDGY